MMCENEMENRTEKTMDKKRRMKDVDDEIKED